MYLIHNYILGRSSKGEFILSAPDIHLRELALAYESISSYLDVANSRLTLVALVNNQSVSYVFDQVPILYIAILRQNQRLILLFGEYEPGMVAVRVVSN